MDKEGNKTGGRQMGTPNKTTGSLKNLLHNFINDNWDQLLEDFKSKRLHPRDRLTFMEKLFRYIIPVMGSGTLDIRKELEKLSDEDLDRLASKIIETQQQQYEQESED